MSGLSFEEAAKNREIRDWASARRIPCPERGPIPELVRQAWEQAEGAKWVETCSGPPYKVPDDPEIVRHGNSGPPYIA